MYSSHDPEWLDARLKERSENRKRERLSGRDPSLTVIDASKFTVPLSELAITLTHKVEREGGRTIAHVPVPLDTGIILRQLTQTYNLLRFINGDDTRFDNAGYQQAYSFVILPLVRTMIDGLYNCTAMLEDPTRSRIFRISGHYRMREALHADEAKHSHDPAWEPFLSEARRNFEDGLRAEHISHTDLDNKANRWPLLGEFIGRRPDTPLKQILRKLTLGFWKEYSSISHATYDGLVSLYQFIASDRIPHAKRDGLADTADRNIAMHLGRASGILLCLLTEIQHFYKFDGPERVDERLGKIWSALIPVMEVRELYDYRYKDLLRHPGTAS